MEMDDTPGFKAELLDLPYSQRHLRFEPVFDTEEMAKALAEGRLPMSRGFALHQHAEVPVVTENGIDTEFRCDYLVLDVNQMVQMKEILNRMTFHDAKTGEQIDDQ